MEFVLPRYINFDATILFFLLPLYYYSLLIHGYFFHHRSKAPDEKTVMFSYSYRNGCTFLYFQMSPSFSWLAYRFKDLVWINS